MIFLDRVARLVAGGEAGANLGAFGVSTFSSIASAGVSTSSFASTLASTLCFAGSSMSVSTSSSGWASTFSLFFLAEGNSKRGLTWGRELASPPSVNFLKIFLPRLEID